MTDHMNDLLYAYIDDELDDSERLDVERHLRQCQSCRTLMEDMIAIKAQVYEAYRSAETPDLESRVMSALEEQQAVAPVERNAVPRWFAGWAVVSAVFAILMLLPFGKILFSMFSIVSNIALSLIYVLQAAVVSEPLWVTCSILFATCLIVISGVSLRRLLSSKLI